MRTRHAVNVLANRRLVWRYLLDHPCVDCGEKDPIVLEFDHVDRSSKTGTISAMVLRDVSEAKITKEIAKCEVRCANCHRRKTALEMGYWHGGSDRSLV